MAKLTVAFRNFAKAPTNEGSRRTAHERWADASAFDVYGTAPAFRDVLLHVFNTFSTYPTYARFVHLYLAECPDELTKLQQGISAPRTSGALPNVPKCFQIWVRV
jgi:hypothetical protein